MSLHRWLTAATCSPGLMVEGESRSSHPNPGLGVLPASVRLILGKMAAAGHANGLHSGELTAHRARPDAANGTSHIGTTPIAPSRWSARPCNGEVTREGTDDGWGKALVSEGLSAAGSELGAWWLAPRRVMSVASEKSQHFGLPEYFLMPPAIRGT